METTFKIFTRLTNEFHRTGGTEAVIDFTVNGIDFSLSACDGVMILWYDDERQQETLFSDEEEDREGLIEWLHYAIGKAIQ